MGLVHVPGQWVFAIRHLQGTGALTGHGLEIVADLFPEGGAGAGGGGSYYHQGHLPLSPGGFHLPQTSHSSLGSLLAFGAQAEDQALSPPGSRTPSAEPGVGLMRSDGPEG